MNPLTSHEPHVENAADLANASDRTTDQLRRLYAVRFFAAVWAGLFAITASALTPISVGLLLLYPLFDAAAAVTDLRSSGTLRPRSPLYVNLALSLLSAIALAFAASSGIPDVVRAWGAWAIAAGVVQVVVALRRHRLGGQRVLVLSGGLSVIAGAAFISMAGQSAPSLASLAGYAALGGIFFLVSAMRLRRAPATTQR